MDHRTANVASPQNGQPGAEVEVPSLRDFFAAQAICNPNICTGTAPEYQLAQWFGGRGGITQAEIIAAQAFELADALIKARAS